MAGHILLLGGSGFIGQALCRRLATLPHDVIVVSHTEPRFKAQNVRWVEGSLDDAQLLHELLPNCEVAFHLASRTTPGASAQAPVREATDNLLPTLRLIETLHQYPHARLVYVSSGGATYGPSLQIPVSEQHCPHPQSYYGAGKVAVEAFLDALRAQGHRIAILRPSNVYGPGQPLRPGFGLVRTVLDHIRHNTAITVWGDGSIVRDYLYIDDLVDALMLTMDPMSDGLFNVGYGSGHSINELISLAHEVTGIAPTVNYTCDRKVDVPIIVLDITAIRNHYGWRPKTPLREGMAEMWRWLNNAAGRSTPSCG